MVLLFALFCVRLVGCPVARVTCVCVFCVCDYMCVRVVCAFGCAHEGVVVCVCVCVCVCCVCGVLCDGGVAVVVCVCWLVVRLVGRLVVCVCCVFGVCSCVFDCLSVFVWVVCVYVCVFV